MLILKEKDILFLSRESGSSPAAYMHLVKLAIEQNKVKEFSTENGTALSIPGTCVIGSDEEHIFEDELSLLKSNGLIRFRKDPDHKRIEIFGMTKFINLSKPEFSKEDDIEYQKYIRALKEILRKPRLRGGDSKSRKQFKKAIEKYGILDVLKVARIAARDEYHIDTNFKYLTPEFLTRDNKIIQFLNRSDKGASSKFTGQ